MNLLIYFKKKNFFFYKEKNKQKKKIIKSHQNSNLCADCRELVLTRGQSDLLHRRCWCCCRLLTQAEDTNDLN